MICLNKLKITMKNTLIPMTLNYVLGVNHD